MVDDHIYHGYLVICKSKIPFTMYYGSALFFLHVNYIIYKHFDRSLHIGSLIPTYVQNFRPILFFEILGFKVRIMIREMDLLPYLHVSGPIQTKF